MAQKILNGVHISGTVRLDFMPTHESEGIITLGRYDANASRYHNIKSYVSSTEASNYLKFSLHNGTTNTVVDVLTLNGNKNATFAGNVGIGNLGTYKLEVSEDGGDSGTADLLLLRNSNSTRAQTFQFQLDTAKDLVITGSSGSGGFKFVPGSRGTTFTGSLTAGSFIKSGGTSAQYLMANGSVTTGVASHNHDSRYTSIDASGDNYTFEIEDEGNFSGNKWYHIANINSHNGGLHIRGAILNHVENFASQKLDIAIQVREAGSGSNVEINGTVDVHHNDAATNSANKAGVRVIQTSTGNTSYQDYKVYVRTTQYSQLTLRLTQQGSVTFNTNHTSPLTSEPAPVSGGSMELDTSALLEGHHVVVDSTVKLTVATDAATFAKRVVVQDNTSTPLSSLFPGTLVVQGNASEDPIIAITDVNTANAAAGVFHQSSVSPGFPALVINAASNGSEQPLISARTNVNNTTGLGGTEVFAVDGDGDATFAGSVGVAGSSIVEKFNTPNIKVSGSTITGTVSANTLFIDNLSSTSRFFSCGADSSTNGTFNFNTGTSEALGATMLTLASTGATFAGSISATSGSFTEETHIADVVDGPFTALRLMNQKTYGSGTGTNEKVRFAMGISESGIAYSGREGFVIDLGISDEGDSSNAIVNFQVRDGGVIGTYQTVNGSDKSVTFAGTINAPDGSATTPAYNFTSHDGNGMYLEDYDATNNKEQVSWATDGTRRAWVNEPGLWTANNLYFAGQLRKFGEWHATSGTSGEGFKFENTADSTTPLTLTSTGNATFAGKMVVGDATNQHQWIVNKAVSGYYSGIKLTRGTGSNSNPANNNHVIWVSDTGLNLGKTNDATVDSFSNVSTHLTLNASGNATFTGAVGIGSTASDFHADANDLVVGGGSGNTGITIHSGTSGYGSIFFADGTADDATEKRGQIRYLQGTERMDFHTDNVATAALSLAAAGDATFAGDVAIAGNFTAGAASPNQMFEFDGNSGNPELTLKNNTATSSTNGTATLQFKQALNSAGGKIVSGRNSNYSDGATRDSHLKFYTATNASDTLALTLDSDNKATFAGAASFAGAIDVTGHIQAFTRVYLRESIQLLNKAADGWLFFATRNTSASEAVYDVSNVGTLSTAGDATFGGSVKVKNALIDNASVTSATATTVVAIVPHATYNAVFFDFVIKNGTNVRAGTVYACHNGASTPLVEFAETSTVDLGDTSDVTLSVAISGANMFLQAVTTSSTWTIKSLIRAM